MLSASSYFLMNDQVTVETEGKSQKELDLKLIRVYLCLAHTPQDSRIESWFDSADHGSLHMTRIDFKELIWV